MGRLANTLINGIATAAAPNCKYCNKKMKNQYWYNEDYPGIKFCKKSCLNKYIKEDLTSKDKGCSLCGKKNKSLNYYESDNGEQYCNEKHWEIGINDPIILDIKYGKN